MDKRIKIYKEITKNKDILPNYENYEFRIEPSMQPIKLFFEHSPFPRKPLYRVSNTTFIPIVAEILTQCESGYKFISDTGFDTTPVKNKIRYMVSKYRQRNCDPIWGEDQIWYGKHPHLVYCITFEIYEDKYTIRFDLDNPPLVITRLNTKRELPKLVLLLRLCKMFTSRELEIIDNRTLDCIRYDDFQILNLIHILTDTQL